ncbi:M48 family metallopeptidase [Dyella subtropica]|uniref:M48 family metallopeptidase n=1 Tax=Dyella subtropica TaxID=2992127 RepID=UPI002251C59B|nr:M48 family metallopeptidase [Dyella subtropica]
MDFFAEQARQRAASRQLVLLFALAVLVIVAMVDVVVWWVWSHLMLFAMPPRTGRTLLFATSALIIGGILACSLYRIRSLSSGGKAVAESVGAERVPEDTQDPQRRRLRNVIEEVAIASGVPVPAIYLLSNEYGINAFAAGYEPDDAAICVTQGCLDRLTRDELQGVIGHEFSHVLNGDMRLNIRIMGLLFGIQVLGLLGRKLTASDSDSGDRRRGFTFHITALGLVLIVAGYVGYFFARLIQAAVSRSRELLADASAVQFTRQTTGLANALKKIAVLDEGSHLHASRAGEVAHMLFGEAGSFNALFATHPPVMERIRALEPWFSERALKLFAAKMEAAEQQENEEPSSPDRSDAVERTDTKAASARTQLAGEAPAVGLYARFGASDTSSKAPLDIQPARLPDDLVQATRQAESALGLVLSLTLSSETELQSRQQRLIAAAFGDDMAHEAVASVGCLRALPAKHRQLLLALAFPSLKRLSAGRRETLLSTVDELVRADGRIDLQEYCLVRQLRTQLQEAKQAPRESTAGTKKLIDCRESYALVGAVLACHGSASEAEARRAWLLAMQDALPGEAVIWPVLPAMWQAAFDQALDELDQLTAVGKELVLQGLLRAIKADGEVSGDEAVLFRLICASLHSPPPAALCMA